MRRRTTGREKIVVSNLPATAVLSIAEQGARMSEAERHFCVHLLEEEAVRLAGLALAARDPQRKNDFVKNYAEHTAAIQVLNAF